MFLQLVIRNIQITRDKSNRPVVTGIADIDIPATASGYTATATFSPSHSGIDSTGYTPADTQLNALLNNPAATSVNYYDNYNCLQLTQFNTLSQTMPGRDATTAKGNLTGTREAIFSGDSHGYSISGSAESLYTLYSYDTDEMSDYILTCYQFWLECQENHTEK